MTEWAGVGGNAAAGAANERPTLVEDGIGGRPALQFDGEDDQLEVATLNINPSVLPELTVVAVFTSDVAEVDETFRKLYGADDEGYDRAAGLDVRADNGDNYVVFGGTSQVLGYFDLEANQAYLTVDAYRPTAFEGWVNGEQTLRAAVEHGEGLPKFFIGGTGTVFPEPWQGKIAEVLVFGAPLPEAGRIALEDLLAAKYGIRLTR